MRGRQHCGWALKLHLLILPRVVPQGELVRVLLLRMRVEPPRVGLPRVGLLRVALPRVGLPRVGLPRGAGARCFSAAKPCSGPSDVRGNPDLNPPASLRVVPLDLRHAE